MIGVCIFPWVFYENKYKKIIHDNNERIAFLPTYIQIWNYLSGIEVEC